MFKKTTHTHTPMCIGFKKKLISTERVKNPTQPFRKHSHLFYQNKPGEYHEWLQPEVLSMSISSELY